MAGLWEGYRWGLGRKNRCEEEEGRVAIWVGESASRVDRLGPEAQQGLELGTQPRRKGHLQSH